MLWNELLKRFAWNVNGSPIMWCHELAWRYWLQRCPEAATTCLPSWSQGQRSRSTMADTGGSCRNDHPIDMAQGKGFPQWKKTIDLLNGSCSWHSTHKKIHYWSYFKDKNVGKDWLWLTLEYFSVPCCHSLHTTLCHYYPLDCMNGIPHSLK